MSAQLSYAPKEIATLLEIGDSTLRKWCSSLETEGYSFARATNNARLFVDQDIIMLRRLKALLHEQKMALESSAKLIVSMIKDEREAAVAYEESSVPQVVHNTYIMQEIVTRLDAQEQLNHTLMKKLEQRDKYIKESMKMRDVHLLEAIQEIHETKKLLTNSIEKEEKRWWKFWKGSKSL